MSEKEKRKMILATVLGCAILLTGCSGSYMRLEPEVNSAIGGVSLPKSAASFAGSSQTMDSTLVEADLVEPVGTTQMQKQEQKLIRTVNLSLQAENDDIEGILQRYSDVCTQMGGYVQNTNQRKLESNNFGSITVLIPASSADQFLENVETDGVKVQNKKDQVEDVSLSYYDLDSRIGVYETQKKKYMEYLDQAESVEDIMMIEGQLSAVISELESLKSQMSYLNNQIEYTTINISVSFEKYDTQTFGGRLMKAFHECGTNFQDTIIFCIASIGVLVPIITFITIMILIGSMMIRFVIRRSKKKHTKTENK